MLFLIQNQVMTILIEPKFIIKKNNMQDYEIIKDANDAEIFIWLNIFISKNISIKRNRCFLICCLNIFYVLL